MSWQAQAEMMMQLQCRQANPTHSPLGLKYVMHIRVHWATQLRMKIQGVSWQGTFFPTALIFEGGREFSHLVYQKRENDKSKVVLDQHHQFTDLKEKFKSFTTLCCCDANCNENTNRLPPNRHNRPLKLSIPHVSKTSDMAWQYCKSQGIFDITWLL